MHHNILLRCGGVGYSSSFYIYIYILHNYNNTLCSLLFNVKRTLYWTEWSTRSTTVRINKASMDGSGRQILHQTDMQQPYGIAVDIDAQVIYWTDVELKRIEASNVDGSNRRVILDSQAGVDRPYALSLHGDMLYISDWNRRILATNKSGDQPVHTVSNTFCTYVSTFGIRVVAEENQLLGELFYSWAVDCLGF